MGPDNVFHAHLPPCTARAALDQLQARIVQLPQTQREDGKMGWTLGIIYFVLLITLGVLSLRKGHWIMFIVGLFIPLFWLIGALMPRRVA